MLTLLFANFLGSNPSCRYNDTYVLIESGTCENHGYRTIRERHECVNCAARTPELICQYSVDQLVMHRRDQVRSYELYKDATYALRHPSTLVVAEHSLELLEKSARDCMIRHNCG